MTHSTITASLINSTDYHRQSQWRALAGSPMRMAIYYCWAIWVYYFVRFLLDFDLRHACDLNFLQWPVFLVGGFLLLWKATPPIAIGRAAPPALLRNCAVTWTFSEDRVEAAIGEFEHRMFKWEVPNTIDILQDGILVRPTPQSAHWIPRSAFADGDAFERACGWARSRAAARTPGISRAAEWTASLLLLPLLAGALQTMSGLMFGDITRSNTGLFYENAPALIAMYYLTFWIAALVAFFPLSRSRMAMRPLPYAVSAAILGTLLQHLFSQKLHIGTDGLSIVAAAFAWLSAGLVHWWMVQEQAGALAGMADGKGKQQ